MVAAASTTSLAIRLGVFSGHVIGKAGDLQLRMHLGEKQSIEDAYMNEDGAFSYSWNASCNRVHNVAFSYREHLDWKNG